MTKLLSPCMAAFLFVLPSVHAEEAASDAVVVPLHDAATPPHIRISSLNGGITVRGEDRKDIAVETQPRRHNDEDREERSDGMHRLDLAGSTGLDIREENNLVTIKTDAFSRGSNIFVAVPRNSSLQIKTVNNGVIEVQGVNGDIEAENLNGAIHLNNVGGSVVAHSLNGAVTADIKSVDPNKPMSFSTMNGEIDVTLPPTIKARVSMKTDNGEILSDFNVKLEPPSRSADTNIGREPDGSFHVHIDKTIHGSINGGGPEYQFRSFNGQIIIRKGK